MLNRNLEQCIQLLLTSSGLEDLCLVYEHCRNAIKFLLLFLQWVYSGQYINVQKCINEIQFYIYCSCGNYTHTASTYSIKLNFFITYFCVDLRRPIARYEKHLIRKSLHGLNYQKHNALLVKTVFYFYSYCQMFHLHRHEASSTSRLNYWGCRIMIVWANWFGNKMLFSMEERCVSGRNIIKFLQCS